MNKKLMVDIFRISLFCTVIRVYISYNNHNPHIVIQYTGGGGGGGVVKVVSESHRMRILEFCIKSVYSLAKFWATSTTFVARCKEGIIILILHLSVCDVRAGGHGKGI